jgi:hypothetical protein
MSTGTPVVVSRIQNRRGTQAQFNALYPVYPNPGSQTALQPGELALITDAPGRVLIGSLNGTYLELAVSSTSSNLAFLPIQLVLPPTGATWVAMPLLDTTGPTPFYSILYSITDAPLVGLSPAAANTVGTQFSKNGELSITAIIPPITPLPYPVSLTDTSTEINAYASPFDISFKAEYNIDGNIQISYLHNFPVALTFSTSSIIWLSL